MRSGAKIGRLLLGAAAHGGGERGLGRRQRKEVQKTKIALNVGGRKKFSVRFCMLTAEGRWLIQAAPGSWPDARLVGQIDGSGSDECRARCSCSFRRDNEMDDDAGSTAGGFFTFSSHLFHRPDGRRAETAPRTFCSQRRN